MDPPADKCQKDNRDEAHLTSRARAAASWVREYREQLRREPVTVVRLRGARTRPIRTLVFWLVLLVVLVGSVFLMTRGSKS